MLIGCNRDKKLQSKADVDCLEFLKEWNPLQYEVESHGCKTYMEYKEKLKKDSRIGHSLMLMAIHSYEF